MSDPSSLRPTVAVGAVVFKGDQVLLIRRGRPPFEGHWSIPGGKIDRGEPHLVALAREVREETGAEIDVLGLIGVFEALPKDETDKHFVMIDFACAYAGGDIRPGDDALDAEFVSIPEAMARLSWDKTRLAIQGALAFRHRGTV